MTSRTRLSPGMELEQRRLRVLKEARKTYNRLKRRGLLYDHITPDRSSEIVAVLSVFACDVHQILKRRERAASRPAPEPDRT